MNYQLSLYNQKKIEDTIKLLKKIFTCIFVTILICSIIFGSISIIAAGSDNYITIRYEEGHSVYIVPGGNTYALKSFTHPIASEAPMFLVFCVYGNLFASLGQSGAFSFEDNAETEPIWKVFNNLYGTLSAVGAGLALLWCLLELIEKASGGHITGEFILQLGIKLTIATVVIMEGSNIARGLIDMGNGVITLFTDAVETSKFTDAVETSKSDGAFALFTEVADTVSQAGIFDVLFTALNILIPALFMIFAYVLALAIMAGRIIELGIRFIFFPIGAADVFTHGVGSPGFRYMKKLMACAMKGGAMYIIVLVGTELMIHPSITGASAERLNWISQVVIGLSMLGAMLKVDSILSDVAGG